MKISRILIFENAKFLKISSLWILAPTKKEKDSSIKGYTADVFLNINRKTDRSRSKKCEWLILQKSWINQHFLCIFLPYLFLWKINFVYIARLRYSLTSMLWNVIEKVIVLVEKRFKDLFDCTRVRQLFILVNSACA